MYENDVRLLAKARRLAGIIECRVCGGMTLSHTGLCGVCRVLSSGTDAGHAL